MGVGVMWCMRSVCRGELKYILVDKMSMSLLLRFSNDLKEKKKKDFGFNAN